jgi:hypothetical protein
MNTTVSFSKIRTALRTRALPVLAAAALLVAAVPASAQLTETLTVEVPFAFVAGKTTLPAGTYVVKAMASKALLLRATDGDHAAIVTTTAVAPTSDLGRSEVSFNRYGDAYFLAQVRPAASTQYYGIPRTKEEARLARNASGPDVVTLRASRTR